MTFRSNDFSRSNIAPVELACLAARLVASGIVAPPSHLIAGDQREPALQRVIGESIAFVELCADALSFNMSVSGQESEAQAIATSAERIKSAAYEAFNSSPTPTTAGLARIGENRIWESLSSEAKSEARRKLARAPVEDFLREANVNLLSPTEKELGSIGETRDWSTIPPAEQSNSIFRLLTNHMVEHGSDQIPALTDATITEYGKEGIPVELAETILWHLKLSIEDRQSSMEAEGSLLPKAEGASEDSVSVV